MDEDGATPLHLAARHNAKEVAEQLIAKGADVNAKDNTGRTPLHDAAWFNAIEVAEPLIAKGADVNAKDEDDKTPLGVAKTIEHEDMAALLRIHGGR